MASEAPHVVGLIADTHGLLRPDVADALSGVEIILHAGDVGGDDILDELERIAPVMAVYGNTDDPYDPRLSAEIVLRIGALTVHVSHGHEVGRPTPERLTARYAADVLVFGHTHQPLIERVGEILVVNPGAAGPRRFDLKPSVARLVVRGKGAEVELIPLNV